MDAHLSTMETEAYSSTPKAGQKRKRGSIRGPQSPDSEGRQSVDQQHDGHGDGHSRHTTTKRACNECRQQKLRCDVVTEPDHVDCSRCRRLKLECRIDANFKRVGKRSRNAAMEREIQELQAKVNEFESKGSVSNGSTRQTKTTADIAQPPDPLTALHQGAVHSLIDLKKSGSSGSRTTRTLGNTQLEAPIVNVLFRKYFEHYHPHIPVLDSSKSPDYYFDCSPLLFWSIISVASRRYADDPTLLTGIAGPLSTLIWTTIAQVPQNYHIVKALCLLCTWPLPTKSTSTDPTFILSGIMMQIALQTGLHRPSHVQDFSRIRVDVRDEDINDRFKTWAACNIVSQAVSTGTGQPPKTIYDYTLTHILEPSEQFPADLFWRLQIERFCNKVSQKLYNNRSYPIGISSDNERAAWISLLVGEYNRLNREISKRDNAVEKLYLHAAGLHLRLSAFFDSPEAPNYANDLLELYFATTKFLNTALDLTERTSVTPATSPTAAPPRHDAYQSPDVSSPTSQPLRQAASVYASGTVRSLAALKPSSTYIMQMLMAGGFTLMKLLNSFFASHIDAVSATRLFNNTIRAIRAISVSNNDLPGRLAEVLAQLWRSSGAGVRPAQTANGTHASGGGGGEGTITPAADNSLQLKVRCRMSMSLLFDSIWRWREEFQYKGGADNSSAALAALEKAVDNHAELDVSGASSNAGSDAPNNNSSGSNNTLPMSSGLHLNQAAAASSSASSSMPRQRSNGSPMPPAGGQQGINAFPSSSSTGAGAGTGGGSGPNHHNNSNSLDATLLNGSDPANASAAGGLPFGQGLDGLGVGAGLGTSGMGDVGYEVFDPLTWMLDGDLGDYGGMIDGGGGGGGGMSDPWV